MKIKICEQKKEEIENKINEVSGKINHTFNYSDIENTIKKIEKEKL